MWHDSHAGVSSESCHVALVHSGCWKRIGMRSQVVHHWSQPTLSRNQESNLSVCESEWVCVSVFVALVRRGSRCRSVCETARGWGGVGRGRVQRSSLAPERTAPDRLFSTPGSLPTTAGDWPTACQSALAPPPCPMRDAETQEGLRHFFSFFFFFRNLND